MKKSELRLMIREVVREELALSIKQLMVVIGKLWVEEHMIQVN